MLARIDRLQSELAEMDDELGRSQRHASLGVLAGMIAHEVRNLMTPIRSYAQLALRDPPDPGMIRKALEIAKEGAERAGDIAESILSLAGRDAGDDAEAIPVRDALERALLCIARPLERDGMRLESLIAPNAVVLMRRGDLQQVLLNLILNATAAIERGRARGGVITVRATRAPGPARSDGCSTWNTGGGSTGTAAGVVVIEVEDNGCGMPPAHAARLLDAPQAQPGCNSGGAGLGLVVCRRLVDAAGGSITVESEEGAGTRFVVLLPAADRAGAGPHGTDRS